MYNLNELVEDAKTFPSIMMAASDKNKSTLEKNKIVDNALTAKQAFNLEVDNGSPVVNNLKVHDYFDMEKTNTDDLRVSICELYCGLIDVLETDDGVVGLKYIAEDNERKLCAVAL